MLKATRKTLCFFLTVAMIVSLAGIPTVAMGDSVPFSESASLSVNPTVNLSDEDAAAREADPELPMPSCNFMLVWNADDPSSSYTEPVSFPVSVGTLLSDGVQLRVTPPSGYYISKLVISDGAEKTLPTIAEPGTQEVSLAFTKFLVKDRSGWNSNYITDGGDLILSLVCDPMPDPDASIRIRYRSGKLADLGFSETEEYVTPSGGVSVPYPSDAEFSTASANGYEFNGYVLKYSNGASMNVGSGEYIQPYMNATITTQWKESSSPAPAQDSGEAVVNETVEAVTPSSWVIPEFTVAANSVSKDYDGTPLTDGGYYTDAGDWGYTVSDVYVSGSQTEPGSSDNVIQSFVLTDPDGNVVPDSVWYGTVNILNGTLTVNPISLTITAINASVTVEEETEFNAGDLNAEGFANGLNISGLLPGHQISGVYAVGQGSTSFDIGVNTDNLFISDENGNNVTSWYTITTIPGHLEITLDDSAKKAAEAAEAARQALEAKRSSAQAAFDSGDYQGVLDIIGDNAEGDEILAGLLTSAQAAIQQAAEEAERQAAEEAARQALEAKRASAQAAFDSGNYQGVLDIIGDNAEGDEVLAGLLTSAQAAIQQAAEEAARQAAEEAARQALEEKRANAQAAFDSGDYQGVLDIIGDNAEGDEILAGLLTSAQAAIQQANEEAAKKAAEEEAAKKAAEEKAAQEEAARQALEAKRTSAQAAFDSGDYQGVLDIIGDNAEGDEILAGLLTSAQAAIQQANEEAAKKAAEEKAAQEEAARKEAEEKAAQEEAARKAAEEKAAQEEAARKAAEEKAAQEEAARKAAEERAAQEEAARKEAEEKAEQAAAARKAAEEEAARKAAEEEAARKAAEEAEAARKAAADEAAAKKAAEEAEAARKAAEEAAAARKAAEEEAARKAAEEEAARKAAEDAAKKAAEEEAARKAAEEAAKKAAEEEAARKAAEEAARQQYRLIVNPRSQVWTYDGAQHSIVEYDYNGLADGDKLIKVSFKPSSVITNVGTVNNEIESVEITTQSGADVRADKYIVTSTPGTLTITPRELTVTAISGSLSVEAGKEIIASSLKSPDGAFNAGYKVEGLVSGHKLSGSFVTGRGTSSYATGIDLTQLRVLDAYNNDVTANYSIRTIPGYITITPLNTNTQKASVPLTVTAKSGSFIYDGNPHSLNEYNVSGLIDGDVIDKVTFKTSSVITDVGTVANEIQSVVIKSSTGAAVDNSKYNISLYSGTLTVTKFPLTLTAVSDEKIYDGNALNNKNVKASALANTNQKLSADYEIFDSNGNTIKNGPVDPGVYTKKVSNVKITSGNQDVTSNYDIKTIDGTLKVTGTVSSTAVNKGTTSIAYYGNPFTIRSDAPYSEFQYLLIDGQRISAEQYTVKEGSTIITLKASFIQSLKTGSHNYTIVSANSKADGNFTVSKSPKTADGVGIVVWILLLLAAAIAVAVGFFFMKRAGKLGGKNGRNQPVQPQQPPRQSKPVGSPVPRKSAVSGGASSPARKNTGTASSSGYRRPEPDRVPLNQVVPASVLDYDPAEDAEDKAEEKKNPTADILKKDFSIDLDQFRTPQPKPDTVKAESELPDIEVEVFEMKDEAKPVDTSVVASAAAAEQSANPAGTDAPTEVSEAESPALPRGRHEAPVPGEAAPEKPQVKQEKEPVHADEVPTDGDSVQEAIDWINAMLNRDDNK